MPIPFDWLELCKYISVCFELIVLFFLLPLMASIKGIIKRSVDVQFDLVHITFIYLKQYTFFNEAVPSYLQTILNIKDVTPVRSAVIMANPLSNNICVLSANCRGLQNNKKKDLRF